jgi:hypothetical protein
VDFSESSETPITASNCIRTIKFPQFPVPNTNGNLEVRVFDRGLKSAASNRLVLSRDLLLGLPFSFVMVLIVIAMKTGSVMLAWAVLLFVLMSMGLGFVWYWLICRLSWFDSFLNLTLFVMVAVGADDFFVIWEAVGLARGDFVGTFTQRDPKGSGKIKTWRVPVPLDIQALDKKAFANGYSRGGASTSKTQGQAFDSINNAETLEMAVEIHGGTPTNRTADDNNVNAVDGINADVVAVGTPTNTSPGGTSRLGGPYTELYLALVKANRRAAASMFQTSFTTALAFFTMILSSVPPVL